MKKTLFLTLNVCLGVSCCISSLHAQTVVTVHSTIPGGNSSTALENIKKITFYDSGLSILKDGDVSLSYPFEEIEKIGFGDTETGIVSSKDETVALKILIQDDYLIVNGWDFNQSASIQIFSMNGSLMQIHEDWSGQPISIGSLYRGLYILSIDRLTFKFNKL